jgi:serine/threonine-protein kinase HSL1, negative regulator of Swe1 kinase
LKPENILMDEARNIKIADFGLAAVTTPFATNLAVQCGTPDFMAPETTMVSCYGTRDHHGELIWYTI